MECHPQNQVENPNKINSIQSYTFPHDMSSIKPSPLYKRYWTSYSLHLFPAFLFLKSSLTIMKEQSPQTFVLQVKSAQGQNLVPYPQHVCIEFNELPALIYYFVALGILFFTFKQVFGIKNQSIFKMHIKIECRNSITVQKYNVIQYEMI